MVELSLKRDGIVILEAYSKAQINRDTGGPKDLDMLMSVEDLQNEFANLEPILCHEFEREAD
ncbi:MAG: hypothetical protein R3C05_06645 [Pirellulaceae bacterium]